MDTEAPHPAGEPAAIAAPTTVNEHGDRGSIALVFLSLALLVGTWCLTHVELLPREGLTMVSPGAVGGDEPSYLMVVDSILFDHDLELQDDYERVRRGGLDAGRRFADRALDHDTIVVNRSTGAHALWPSAYSARRPGSAEERDCLACRAIAPDFQPGPDLYEVSAHPIAYPLFLAAVIAPTRPSLDEVERRVGLVMVLLSWLGACGTYLLARRVGCSRGPSLLATAILVLASPWLAYARSYYSEPLIGVSLVFAALALRSGRPGLAATGAAAAAMIKPPFAMIGLGWVLERVSQRDWRSAGRMLIVLVPCALATLAFNWWLARTPVIFGGDEVGLSRDFRFLYLTLFQPSHGLFVFAPWTVFAFAAGIEALRPASRNRSGFQRQVAVPALMFLALLGLTAAGPAYSYGPRYWIPFLPWFAVSSVEALRDTRATPRIVFAVLVLTAMVVAIPGALRYPQLYSRIGFVHHFRTLGSEEVRAIIADHADQFSVSFDRDAFVDAAGVAAIIRASNGNFRLLQRLFQQIERVLELNDLLSVTPEVVTAARESLVIGAN